MENFGFPRAESYISDLVDAFQLLADNNKLGRGYAHVKTGLYAYNHISHVVFYKVNEKGVDILRVLHSSMDYEQHLEK